MADHTDGGGGRVLREGGREGGKEGGEEKEEEKNKGMKNRLYVSHFLFLVPSPL